MSRMQFRIYNPNASLVTETPVVGEPFWDPIAGRFGVFNNIGGQPSWYPAVTNTSLVVNEGQLLRGRASGGLESSIVLDWGTTGELRIVDKSNNDEVLASFAGSGSQFANAASITTATNAIFNRLVNSNMLIGRPDDLPVLSSLTYTYNTNVALYPWAPNWYSYKPVTSAGTLVFSKVTTGLPSEGISGGIRINASGAPTAGGLRHYVFSPGKGNVASTITASAYIKGPLGAKCRIRLRDNTDNINAVKEVTGTGAWVRESITVTAPAGYNPLWLAFDSIEAPGFNRTSSTSWYVCAPTLCFGSNPAPLEDRNYARDLALTKTLWGVFHAWFPDGVYAENYVDFDFPSDFGTPRWFGTSPTGAPAVASLTYKGGLFSQANLVNPSLATIIAYLAPVTAVTG